MELRCRAEFSIHNELEVADGHVQAVVPLVRDEKPFLEAIRGICGDR